MRPGQRRGPRRRNRHDRQGLREGHGRPGDAAVAPARTRSAAAAAGRGPVTPGQYKGLLDGNFVFFEITADRMVTGFRSNYLREDCNGNLYIYGTLEWGSSRFPIAADGTFSVSDTGTGTIEDQPASFTDTVSGKIDGTTVTGTVTGTADFTYQGTRYQCSSGVKSYTATLQP